jgi:DNA-binding transcriptional MerR regulator
MDRQGKARDVRPVIARKDWATTAEVAAAAEVHQSTLGRWQRRGLLPAPVFVSLGKRGRSQRWPPETIAQVRWIKDRLEEGWTFSEIAAALERGEHKPPGEKPQG